VPREWGRSGRIGLAAAVAASWLVAVPLMWRAVTTVPSAQRLQAMSSRIMHVPSPTTFLRTAGQSLVELLVLLLLLWPFWRRLWLARLLVAFLALGTWAVLTMPLELTTLEQVHHQWLVGCDVALFLAMVVTLLARIVGAVRR
jgi:hypothetical protein